MTTDLCTDDVVVHISGPQILSTGGIVQTESLVTTCAGAGAGGAGPRGGGAGGGAELGRRLLVAARAGDTRAVLDLMAKGAPFTTDWLGTSALHLAAGAGHADTCAVLARAGVSRDARTKVERTPLHLAACAGHTAVVELLLDLGAAIDCRDMLRMTPLQWAAARGHGAAAAALVRRGADVSLVDKFGHTARALAARRGHQHVVRALDDAARAREAQRSVRALQADQMPETSTIDAQMRSYETVQKITDETTLKHNKPQEKHPTIKTEPLTETSEEPQSEGAAAQLLRKHGITLLPADDGSTVLNAIQSGRTVVLSDAGKLMLKESDELATLSRVSAPPAAPGAPPAPAAPAAPVLLAATPVRAPPKPGVKVFTLNNKVLLPTHAHTSAKKIIHPNDLQVKFVQLPADSKLTSPVKTIPMKAKAKATVGAPGARPAVKIIMNKANFNKLLANATTTLVSHAADAQAAITSSMGEDGSMLAASGSTGAEGVAGVADVCAVSAELVARSSPRALRALLTRALAELRDARKALAQLRSAPQR